MITLLPQPLVNHVEVTHTTYENTTQGILLLADHAFVIKYVTRMSRSNSPYARGICKIGTKNRKLARMLK
jgi:hypothetical protein